MEVSLIGALVQMARDVSSLAPAAQANRRQCSRLAQRVVGVANLLEPVRQRLAVSPYSDAQLSNNLRYLEKVFKDAQAHISVYTTRSWPRAVFADAANPQAFEKLNRELSLAGEQLGMGQSVRALFSRTDDASDLSADIAQINERQDEIIQLVVGLDQAGAPTAERTNDVRRQLAMALSSSRAFVPKTDALLKDTMASLVEDFIIPWTDLKLVKRLGGGAFGEVHLAKWKGIDDVAVKILKSSTTFSMRREITNGGAMTGNMNLGAMSPEDQKATEEFMNELKLMAKLRHPNIVQLMAVVLEPNRKALIMEFMPAGSLFDVITKRSLTWPNIINIANDIAKGCAYLIRMGVLHRDLKSGNVMVRDDLSAAKICDFGLSQNLKTKAKDVVGSIRWIAPELFDLNPNTEKSDVFAFGMVLYELVSRRLPFHDLNDEQVEQNYRRGLRPPIPDKVPRGFASIIEHCWHQDPAKRPTFAQMIEEGWFESNPTPTPAPVAVPPRQAYSIPGANPYYGQQMMGQGMPVRAQPRGNSMGASAPQLKIPPRIESKQLMPPGGQQQQQQVPRPVMPPLQQPGMPGMPQYYVPPNMAPQWPPQQAPRR